MDHRPAGRCGLLAIGGIRYLAASGDPAAVEKAKSAFKSALVGHALSVLAPILLAVLPSLIHGWEWVTGWSTTIINGAFNWFVRFVFGATLTIFPGTGYSHPQKVHCGHQCRPG